MHTLMLANTGVPMFIVLGPVFAMAFIPIVVIETWILRRRLSLPLQHSLAHAFVANVFSTLIGVPITYVVLLILQLATGGGGAYGPSWLSVTWQAPWLIPYEEHLGWMIPSAALFLCFPFFVVSWASEAWVLRRRLKDKDRKQVSRATLLANATTYALMAAFWLARLYLNT
ncbi:MAG: hypothetical protein U0640_09565 [Phycisphaerales bacterium]